MKLVKLMVVFVCLLTSFMNACTVLIVNGLFTDDGRPILCKSRHPANPDELQYVTVNSYYTYRNVSVNRSMGVNTEGFATGNAAMSPNYFIYIPESQSPLYLQSTAVSEADPDSFVSGGNYAWNGHVVLYGLDACSTVSDIEWFVDTIINKDACLISSNNPYMDAQGGLTLWEYYQWDIEDSSFYKAEYEGIYNEYNPLNPSRISQGTYGFVVRDTDAHNVTSGMDNMLVAHEGRFQTGVYNIKGMLGRLPYDEPDASTVSIDKIARGTNGPGGDFEFMRYGPGRELEEMAAEGNRSSVIIHGVLPGEDPLLTTMWTGLGQNNFSIYVPIWAQVTDNNPVISHQYGIDANTEEPSVRKSYCRSMSLFRKALALEGESVDASLQFEHLIQNRTFPFEQHLFNEVKGVILPHWREFGVPLDANGNREAENISKRIAEDAYSLLHCLDFLRDDNYAPEVTFSVSAHGNTVKFFSDASDCDGTVSSVFWNFDNSISQRTSDNKTLFTSEGVNAEWTYAELGEYLVSCTVTDNEDVSNTKWAYVSVPGEYDISGNGVLGIEDVSIVAENWLSESCGEPYWCGGVDFTLDGTVDFADFTTFAYAWLSQQNKL